MTFISGIMSSPASLTSPSKSSLAPPQLSPIHRIGNHLPNQKRSYLTPTKTCSPLAKRIRAEMATSPDMRRGLLVRQLLQRMPGITVTAVDNKESSIIEISEEDCSVVEIEHKPANLSQVCEDDLDVVEEHDNEKTDLVEIPEVVRDEEDCEEDVGLIEKPVILVEKNHEDLEDKDKYKAGAATLVGGIGEKGKKEKIKNNKVSISWKSVRRLKRKTKLFIFNDCVDGKAEIYTVSQEDSQRMPVVLGGRRPMMLVPGIDYGLEEGEDVMVCPEEEREVRLATVEQYNIDSFCLEAGYLSLAEMAETPPVDNVVRKVKQKRRANGVKVRYYLGKF